MPLNDCTHNTDPLMLVREGLSQAQRQLAALAPEFAPVDQHGPAHRMIFARAYSAYLRFFNEKNLDAGDWQPFFSSDVSVQLAVASVQDVAFYKAGIKSNFDFLNQLDNDADLAGLRLNLGQLFGSAATLAAQLDQLALGLPSELPLKAQLQNLIRRQLAPALKSLLLYHRDGLLAASPPPAGPYLTEAAPAFDILGAAYTLPQALQTAGRPLSSDWIADDAATTWPQYLVNLDNLLLYPDTGVYGSGTTLFSRVNHIATHNLFTSIFERFLKVYARTVGTAAEALEASFTARDSHEPHYGLFLAFLRLFERVRAESNTLTARHLDFYYREVLRLKEKGAQPGHVHLLGELAKVVPAHLLAEGTLVKAGKDAKGKDAFFALSRDTVLNQASVASLQTVYRHDAEPVAGAGGHDAGRLYASPVANSSDGLGAPLTPEQPSWHPFHNKIFADGALAQIRMPNATLGFAVASHYLLLAEGERSIDLRLTLAGPGPSGDLAADAVCLLSTAAGWLEKAPDHWRMEAGVLHLSLHLNGADPAIVAYQEKVHGARFGVQLPVLQVLLRQRPDADYPYARLQDVLLRQCALTVDVVGVKTLSVSNDFGPVDTSKPFQPFGALPAVNSKLVIGARELFQKKLDAATVRIDWQSKAVVYPTSATPTASVDYLVAGQWQLALMSGISIGVESLPLTAGLNLTLREAPDLSPPEFYGNDSRQGYLRLRLNADLGQAAYQTALIDFLHGKTTTQPTPQPVAPVMAALTMDYTASQTITLDSADAAAFKLRQARFFHIAPFGQAEQHPLLNSAHKVCLLPQFAFHSVDSGVESGGEFYIGVAGLKPPQNLALLMQVVAGTADPQTPKPPQHIQWSYLRRNEWVAFAGNEVGDGTAGLLASGIVTLSVPRDANADNILLAPGMHWIRLAVASKVDAVCRLLMVAAQALEAQFADQGNDPAFAATVLPAGVVTKLAVPDAAVKQLSQPFASFGGRGAEAAGDFYTRVSERLRHKDRAIALWDYEHLVLEAFPQIYKVKCLNHTQYEPAPGPGGIYRELAPGHVTIVTVPNQQFQNLRDPLRPFTSLDLLQQVDAFLRQRSGCFVRLHVRNPKFEEVRLDFKVGLRDGFDETFYVKQLREEITRFLSPWAFPGGAAPSFGGKVYKSVLINFVEERPYVDYVSDFKLFHDIDGVAGTVDLAMVGGSLAVSILVSVPAVRHAIEVLHPLALAGAAEHCPCEAS
ncbi:baseplate J/gp47 family protein [Rugamonas sp. CCM 8940]|uniref:baseplate J/gp47 family protein n=1 Tax=Rugamonas sp. CCM 8940 TaxID=2765359 RepID=UPI0018F77C84|nr:baseplate J/gp47 family protein [Rugamonas sp. CCM 8940]MBJ7312003.1 baseplate J/gp47 family protein [Rugamonas sp. CCM 8940]